jgi:hypothetical protein
VVKRKRKRKRRWRKSEQKSAQSVTALSPEFC